MYLMNSIFFHSVISLCFFCNCAMLFGIVERMVVYGIYCFATSAGLMNCDCHMVNNDEESAINESYYE
ncbi:hypothetical protein L1887_01620 [Cichorium endivia]|nr:hypothetical protein L1887_01620 [Cichorium endivia]